jgi:uncharacterized protein (TIGR03435 family)
MRRPLIILLLSACGGLGQAPSPPAFEIVSVKRVTPDEERLLPIGLFTYPGGRIRATNYTLRQLIHDAYHVEMHEVIGGPAWVDTDPFVVEAKPPESSPSSKWVPANFKTAPNDEMRRMLQSLLADRFQLKVHRESRKASVFALVAGGSGHKLKSPADTTAQPFVSFGRTGPVTAAALSQTFVGRNATMDQLAERLAQHLGRPVSNETRITGNFDFLIEYGATDSQAANAPPLVRAIQDQAGLKLETRPGTIEVVVIDSANRPSAN